MTMTATMDEGLAHHNVNPGAQLAAVRAQKGLSTEYVAGKLHLRLKLIEQIEADDYLNMPETVFIKGYLRAYAKLIDMSPEPLLDAFNRLDTRERKTERALWQSKRERHRGEHIIRWVTALFAMGVMVAVGLWWHSNKDNERLFPEHASQVMQAPTVKQDRDIRLTDLSKMREVLSSSLPFSPVEKTRE